MSKLDLRGMPRAGRGQSVGLLGGSFDPPHSGHVAITLAALKRFDLDRIWWLVTPGNPLKSAGPERLERRLAAGRAMMQHPRVHVTDLEARLGTRYTAETIARLQQHYPHIRFVWLMGADNLAQFHRWQDWQDIMMRVPMGVMARPGDRLSARRSVAARRFEHVQLPGTASQLLARAAPPCWCYINLPLSEASSTALRAKGAWDRRSEG